MKRHTLRNIYKVTFFKMDSDGISVYSSFTNFYSNEALANEDMAEWKRTKRHGAYLEIEQLRS